VCEHASLVRGPTVSVIVPAEDRARLAAIIDDPTRPPKHVQRARVILQSADQAPSAYSSPSTQWRVRDRPLHAKAHPSGVHPLPQCRRAQSPRRSGGIQNDFFDLGADLRNLARLEREIDAVNGELMPLDSVVLPGGTACAAYLHLARKVVRRAERLVDELARTARLNPQVLKYLSRLSDPLFVLSRHLNDNGARDVLWLPGVNRQCTLQGSASAVDVECKP